MSIDIDIGPPTEDVDIRRFADIASRSLSFPVERASVWFERAGLGNLRVARRGSDVVAGHIIIPMGHWVGGRPVRCLGISGVAVAPEHRSQGVCTEMMRVVLEEARRDGVALSSLFPATAPVYRGVGYQTAGTRTVLRVQIANLGAGARDLEVHEVPSSRYGALRELYDTHARDITGAVTRTPYFWTRIHEPVGEDARAFLVDGDEGPEGYVVLSYRPAPSPLAPNELLVRDVVARTPRAARRILRLLADHRSVARTVTMACSPADPMVSQVAEPRLEVAEMQSWMLRIVDVRVALEGRGWPACAHGELHVDLRDELLRENSRRWVIEVAGGRVEVREGGSGALRLDVRGLAGLYTGFLTGFGLRAAGLGDGPDGDLATASALFSGPAAVVSDFF